MKSQLIGKEPDAVKDWGQEEKEVTEDEMVGWHHWLSGHDLAQSPGDGEGQGSLDCSPWGHKESDTIKWLNNNSNKNSQKAGGLLTPPFSHAVGRLIEDSSCESTLQNIIFLEYSNIPFLEEEAEAQGGLV